MPNPKVTVAVPTLASGDALADCLRSLEAQTLADFEVVVVDNSGSRRAQVSGRARVIANERNVGFGAAVNQAFRSSEAPYLATLNDDAEADPRWLEALVESAEAHPRAGMFASQVRLSSAALDSIPHLTYWSWGHRGWRRSWSDSSIRRRYVPLTLPCASLSPLERE